MLKRLFEGRIRRLSLHTHGVDQSHHGHSGNRIKRLLHNSFIKYKAKSHYETLELTPNATQAQIKAAYYRLSMLHHPDKSQGQKDIDNRFQAITEAYETLSNVDKRRSYDRGIMVHPAMRGGAAEARGTGQEGLIRKRPNSGRTEFYNFDEFYKMHYGSTLRKRQAVKMEYEQFVRERAQKKKPHSSISVLVGLILLLMFIVSASPNPYDAPPFQQNPKNSD